MVFYTPATIVKDARRHGLKIQPVCVQRSIWRCAVIADDTFRLGFCVVNGLRQEHAEELVRQRQGRQFDSLEDFKRRVPLSKEELRTLAELGALNCFADHRRAAMWKVEETLHDDLLGSARVSRVGFGVSPKQACESSRSRDAIASTRDACATQNKDSPLQPMTLPERVRSDYETMNLTTGPHPMKLFRESLPNVGPAADLAQAPHGPILQTPG